jgi:hypothetical protein
MAAEDTAAPGRSRTRAGTGQGPSDNPGPLPVSRIQRSYSQISAELQQDSAELLDSDALSQVAGLVYVAVQLGRHMVGEQLQRNVEQQRLELWLGAGHPDDRIG